MSHVNRYTAAIATLAIMAIVITFAYGYYVSMLEAFFSFSVQSLAVKLALTIGLLVIVFFGRPHSRFRRVFFGIIASIALGFGTYGAFTESLLLGDAITLIIGTVITTIEATETAPTTQPVQSGRGLSPNSKMQQL